MRFTSMSPRRITLAVSCASLASLSLACLATVDGDRAASGDCPAGEVCSDATPEGLSFVGQALFDQPVPMLGPVIVGGTFELGLHTRDGSPLPAFDADLGAPSILTASRGTGTFGPLGDEGEPLYPVDAYLVLRAHAPGTAMVRIVDPATGALLDRLPLQAIAIDDVRLVVARDPEREHLYAGCREMIGVRFVSGNDGEELRGFDQEARLEADRGALADEPLFWDCVAYEVPSDGDEAGFDVHAGGTSFRRTMPIRTLAEDGLTECPPTSD